MIKDTYFLNDGNEVDFHKTDLYGDGDIEVPDDTLIAVTHYNEYGDNILRHISQPVLIGMTCFGSEDDGSHAYWTHLSNDDEVDPDQSEFEKIFCNETNGRESA